MLNENAIARLSEIKERPQDKPFSLHIAQKDKLEDFAIKIPVAAYKLIHEFWPGPLTLVLKSSRAQSTIGIRMPDNEIALRIISLANVPVVCPSANLSGKPAPVSFQEAILDLDGKVDFAIDAGVTKLKVESSVVDVTQEPAKVLREGAIKKEAIERTIKRKNVLFVCTGNSCRSVMAEELLKKIMRDKNRDDVEVYSAGIMMFPGMGITQGTREVLMQVGIDATRHHAQKINKEMIKRSDIILTMDRMHEESVLKLAPEVKDRLFLLKEFAKINDNDLNIADPIGKPLSFYEMTFAIIKEAVERVSNII
jgi:tRNA threonylcarbamoyl adenosine modification protein (Sua5/YciO/YrdC/YwlC family)